MKGLVGRLSLGIALVAGSLGLPNVAKADHECFHYHGQCFQFAGERQMLGALENLEQAFNNPAQARAFVKRADWEATFALDAVIGRRTQFYLQSAMGHMDHFLWCNDPHELESAAEMVQKAIVSEQRARGCGGPAIPAPVAPPVQVPSYIPVPQQQVVVPVPPPQPRGGIRIGTKHGSFFFAF